MIKVKADKEIVLEKVVLCSQKLTYTLHFKIDRALCQD